MLTYGERRGSTCTVATRLDDLRDRPPSRACRKDGRGYLNGTRVPVFERGRDPIPLAPFVDYLAGALRRRSARLGVGCYDEAKRICSVTHQG